jgi:phage tail sheath protein FI
VFEQNTAGTRNRFLNIVNPFLDSVQANSGLSAFRVVMDESNNTPDVVDRNRLVGQIYIQPTRTAEFIVLDFVVLPTGATFPE